MPRCRTGVYQIRNLTNGKVYIGSASVSFSGRWNTHKSRLHRGVHKNLHLQSSWDKYGESCFRFEILERCQPDNCVSREQFWLDSCRAYNPIYGYNQNPTAGSSLGRNLSEEHKEKIGNAHRGMKRSAETGQKISAALRGRSKQGIKPSAETKAKISAALTGKKRQPHSETTKAKMSAASKGKPKSIEHRLVLSVAKLGKKRGQYRTRTDSSSGVAGVIKRRGKWAVMINKKCFGTYATIEQAAAARVIQLTK